MVKVAHKNIGLLVLFLASFGILYRDVIAKLVMDWYVDENYSHGFLVVPVALYFAWERRQRFAVAPGEYSKGGLALVLLSQGMLLAGILGAEVFTTEVAM